MSQSLPPNVANQLNSAFQAIQQGRADEALKIVNRLTRKYPRQIDVLHIAALAYKAKGDVRAAEQFFKRCLAVEPRHSQVLNNLGNLQKSQGRFKEASDNYKKAISANPNYLDAQRNLGLCYAAQEQYDPAISAFSRALELSPSDISTRTALADCRRMKGELDAAEREYLSILESSPNASNALHNLGLTYHMQGEMTQANECYRRAFEASSGHPVVTLSYANSIHELGDSSAAISLLQDALTTHGQQVAIHQRLNELLWESDRQDEFGNSYEKTIAGGAATEELCVAYAKQMFRSGDNQRTRKVLDAVRPKFPRSAKLTSLLGQVLADEGELDVAHDVLSKSLKSEFSKPTAQQLCKLLLIKGEYESAQGLIGPLQKRDPDCQLTWALQSLIWRLTENPKYAWLCDYDTVVKPYFLPVPDGFDSLGEFLPALKSVLLDLHRTERAPLEQTLLNGTQTAPRLLHNPNPTIQAFKSSLESVVSEYIADMPSNSEHPLYQRRSDQFSFSGSWSVRLRPNGFHVNHVHPAGWISSSSYISIPEGANEDLQEGAIKFGESPLALGDREVIEKIIQPRAGMVVLFPSFVWHGTVPFSGAESDYRLTAPFDVVPVQ